MYWQIQSLPLLASLGQTPRTDMDSINKHLCSFRFAKENLTKLKRVAVARGTSMTEILEMAIIALPERAKRKK